VPLIEPTVHSPRGIQDNRDPADQAALAPSVRRARDGSVLWWGGVDTPGPPPIISPGVAASVTVAVSPVRPGHAITVEYRVNGGPVRQAIGQLEPRVPDVNARMFRADLPGQSGGLVEFLPVLHFAGQPISPGLAESAECSRYQVGCRAVLVETADSSATPSAEPAGEPRWAWSTRFLWSATIIIRKEVVGELPDGLRINWYVVEGRFAGPSHEGIVLPGAADSMRIRKDGIGIVDVTELLQTRGGARLYCSYGGIFDLGAAGYARALGGEFDATPPFVGTPTYATADKELAWLNRAQCIAVGRVDMKALRVDYDVYRIGVGDRKHPPAHQRAVAATTDRE
jgi:Protein of unknown function (DUF3237)